MASNDLCHLSSESSLSCMQSHLGTTSNREDSSVMSWGEKGFLEPESIKILRASGDEKVKHECSDSDSDESFSSALSSLSSQRTDKDLSITSQSGQKSLSKYSMGKQEAIDDAGKVLAEIPLRNYPNILEEKRKSVSDMSICTYPTQSSQGEFCRICHCEGDCDIGPLIAPCHCRGSLRFVHQDCLQQWIKSSNSKNCELCGCQFIMDSKLKPLLQWQNLTMSPSEQRKLICTVIFHIIAISCVSWSLYVLIEKTAVEIKEGQLQWPFWTKLAVVAVGFTGGLVFMYMQCKVYVQLWRKLKAFNRVIFVQNNSTMTSNTSEPTLSPDEPVLADVADPPEEPDPGPTVIIVEPDQN